MNNGPRRGRRSSMGTPEKAKNFQNAIKRLFRELKSFYFLIILSLVLAALGSVLSILAPDKLSQLTDKISEGLVVNRENMTILFEKIGENLSNERLEQEIPNILSMNLSEKNIENILSDETIKEEEKKLFQNLLIKMEEDKKTLLSLGTLSNNILEKLFPHSKYKDIEISTSDKINFIRSFNVEGNMQSSFTLPESIGTILLEDIKIDDVTISIDEQIKMINNAHKENADILVLECMAVNPELQYVCEHQILEADVTVITNVRLDHVQDMGDNLEDIAYAFCNTIPTNGHLVVNDSEYVKLFKEKAKELGTTVHVAKPYENEDTLDTFTENIAVALEVARVLNLDLDLFFEGMKNYHHDFGAFSRHKIDNTLFLNGLSINDPESIKYVYDEIAKKYDLNNVTILLNNRGDRPTRVLQHIELLSNIKCKKILLIGSNLTYVKNKLEKKLDIEIELLENIEDLKKEEIIFAIGNIGGKGMEVIEYFHNNGEKI